MSRLPDFICLGSQKSGTTWLYDELKRHSDIDLPDKELRRFHPWNLYSDEYYLNIFKDLKGVTGEFTPEYFVSPVAPFQIKNLIPNCKLFVILRNPADRAFSQWRMARDTQFNLIDKNKSFLECFDADDRWLRTKGIYAVFLRNYLNVFDKCKVFLYDDLLENPVDFVYSVCDYLGTNKEYHNAPWRLSNYHKEKLNISLSDYQHAMNFYEKHILDLEQLIGIKTKWMDSSPKYIKFI